MCKSIAKGYTMLTAGRRIWAARPNINSVSSLYQPSPVRLIRRAITVAGTHKHIRDRMRSSIGTFAAVYSAWGRTSPAEADFDGRIPPAANRAGRQSLS